LFEFLASTLRQEKEIKGIQIANEEVKLSLFADAMILYLKDPKYSITKLLSLILLAKKNTVLLYKNQLSFIYTYNKQTKKEIRITIPLTISSKKIKVPRNKFRV
jgi:hypothetical protein